MDVQNQNTQVVLISDYSILSAVRPMTANADFTPDNTITKNKMSPASIGGEFRLLFSAAVQSAAETLNNGALPLIEKLKNSYF